MSMKTKGATVTLPLKTFLKMHAELEAAKAEQKTYKETVDKWVKTAQEATRHEERMKDAWDDHSHRICNALSERYSDDGTGFDYEQMIRAIEGWKEDAQVAMKKRAEVEAELVHTRDLVRTAKYWKSRGNKSHRRSVPLRKLWEAVDALEKAT